MTAARAAAALTVALAVSACTKAGEVRTRVAAVERTLAEATASGAVRCAARELAEGEAHLRFARGELEQGRLERAREHVTVAEPNAEAALLLALDPRCERRTARVTHTSSVTEEIIEGIDPDAVDGGSVGGESTSATPDPPNAGPDGGGAR